MATIEIDVGILNILSRKRLHSEQIRCLMTVLSRPGEVLNLGVFQKATGISKPHICRALKALTVSGLLSATCDPAGNRRYLIPGFNLWPAIHKPDSVFVNDVSLQPDSIGDQAPGRQMPGSFPHGSSGALSGNVAANGNSTVAMAGNVATEGKSIIAIRGNDVPSPGNDSTHGNKVIATNGNMISSGGPPVSILGNCIPSGGNDFSTQGNNLYLPASNTAAFALILKRQQAKAAWESLFGAKLPEDFDISIAEIMVDRRTSGKLTDIKKPLAYLSAMSKKIVMPGTESTVVSKQTIPLNSEKPMIFTNEEFNRKKAITESWQQLSDSERAIYYEKAKFIPTGRLKVSINFLAKRAYIWSCMKQTITDNKGYF